MDEMQFVRMLREKAAKTAKAKEFAERTKEAVLLELAPHRKTGEHAASTVVTEKINSQGVLAPFVEVKHKAAQWSNGGHWQHTAEGPKWVEGIHYLEKAAKRINRGY